MNNTSDGTSTLPTSRALIRSTVAAAGVALLVLVTAVLPAEYGIDPTGAGEILGLTQMGKLKAQLAKDADAAAAKAQASSAGAAASGDSSSTKNDSMVVTLEAGETIEVKLTMRKGQRALYAWQLDSGLVYYDLHGETMKLPRTAPHRYSEGTLRGAQGELVAEFDGVHGWYWENKSEHAVRIVVRAWGQFQSLIEM